jgi:hypothetical protein
LGRSWRRGRLSPAASIPPLRAANLDSGDTAGACDKLASFIDQVKAQRGEKIDADDADELIAEAEAVRDSLGC